MKRRNPKTNLPFKYGDVREDGYMFCDYVTTKIKKDGFFSERWLNPISFKNENLKKCNRTNQFRKNNPEKVKLKDQNYRKNNPKKIKQIKKNYRLNNFEKIKLKDQNYRLNNKDKVNAKTARRRATKLNATPYWLTDEHKKEIIRIYKNCLEISKQTGVQHHVDHIVPLKGKEVCGLHVPWNLQILTATENISKNNRLVEH